MSGSIVRAIGWQVGVEERYLGVNPSGESVALYQTNSTTDDEDANIFKVTERTGFDNIQCIQYSSQRPGRTGLGLLDGHCMIFDITNSEEAPLVLRPRQARSCNSISFNNEGLVALGYDRGRQDNSVQIWQVDRAEPTKMGSYVQNESISSVAFSPSEASKLVTGSYKLLREFDLRTGKPVYQLATRCTLNVCMDPSNPHIYASNSEDGSLAIWDRRKLSDLAGSHGSSAVLNETPVLFFHKLLGDYQRRTSGVPYHFSSLANGELSALFDGDLVRRWQIGVVPPLKSELRQYETILEQSKSENPNFTPRVSKPRGSLFISKVSDVHTKYERVISFDYARSATQQYGLDLVCMRQSGSVYKMPVKESQTALHFDCYNGLSFSGPSGTCTKLMAHEPAPTKPDVQEVSSTPVKSPSGDVSPTTSVTPSVDMFIDRDTATMTSDALLGYDICSVMRKRAVLGYSTDCGKNMSVIESLDTLEAQSQLHNTWKWIDISRRQVTSGKMSYENFDFGYMGVYGVWTMPEGFRISERYFGDSKKMTDREILAAAKAIVARRQEEIKSMAAPVIGFKGSSQKETQRRLAMYVIGWDFSINELEEKYERLVSKGDYTRAAGWALFHGNIQRAVNLLGSSPDETLRIISTAMAGYSAFKDTPTNNTWKDQCRQLASDLDDPYLRVIFAYIADGNWWDVLDENALPLREKLGVALRFLKDSDLDLYLERLVNEETKRGEVEGIIVSGITHEGIDLLQSFVDRTSDTQSACMIASFACPKYFEDVRVDLWCDSYRTLLNSWGLFAQRAKFDVARRGLSLRMNGQVMSKLVPRQVYLQCTNCHQSLSEVGAKLKPNGKVCPHCGYPLPRCAICLITQGESVPEELIHVSVANRGGKDEDATRDTPFKEWFSFCLSCNHCMHAGHAEEWFSKHYVCPVPDCNCKCNSR